RATLSLDVERDHGGELVDDVLGDADRDLADGVLIEELVDDRAAADEVERRPGPELDRAADATDREPAHGDRVVRSREEMKIDATVAARRGAVELPRREARARADDALAVGMHPASDRVQTLLLLRRDAAVAARADVEQQPTAAAGHLAQRVYERAWRL